MFTLRHGDCVGVDAEVAKIAHDLGYIIFCHPPVDDSLRAFYDADFTASPKNHFARNRDIVDNSDLLIVVPMDNERKTKGGTWYTYDYAIKKRVAITVFYPDGRIEYDPESCLVFTETERNLIISHWLENKYRSPSYEQYYLLNNVMADMYCDPIPKGYDRPVWIVGRQSYSVSYVKLLDETIISFLINTPLGQKTFENLPQQIKNKILENRP
jgi:hypothetical protein